MFQEYNSSSFKDVHPIYGNGRRVRKLKGPVEVGPGKVARGGL